MGQRITMKYCVVNNCNYVYVNSSPTDHPIALTHFTHVLVYLDLFLPFCPIGLFTSALSKTDKRVSSRVRWGKTKNGRVTY